MCLWLIKMVRWLYFMVSGILISFSNEYSSILLFLCILPHIDYHASLNDFEVYFTLLDKLFNVLKNNIQRIKKIRVSGYVLYYQEYVHTKKESGIKYNYNTFFYYHFYPVFFLIHTILLMFSIFLVFSSILTETAHSPY